VLKKRGRYDVSGLTEAQFEPGSRGRILKNRVGIRTKRELDRVETAALARTVDSLVRTYGAEHRFTAADICHFHKTWLGDIYEWAGRYRQVNVGKGGFAFASSAQIPKLMRDFETGPLQRYTPCNFAMGPTLIRALAEAHVELMLIHPFRDGNGRVGRILASLMALQAGLPLLDFSSIKGKRKQEYFAAVRAGLDENYGPMEGIFEEVIAKSVSKVS